VQGFLSRKGGMWLRGASERMAENDASQEKAVWANQRCSTRSSTRISIWRPTTSTQVQLPTPSCSWFPPPYRAFLGGKSEVLKFAQVAV
jgi:hypothetical protein